ncbi:MAG: iron ABC transporter substrate-binding protein [candidate division NC10 bacterium RIFCSPLOWO2_02_FULL_66_22]|nr:MAG: iron ABC transporter substrate-binding protein [candidate division NC10 bacterium RIFCSPLOWO2_02_FULL_66_22]
MRKTSALVLLAIALVVLFALPAFAGENKVTILCSPDPAWCEAVKREFSKTGIQTEFVRLSSGAALARLRAEKANPAFDVWFGGTGDPHWVAQAEGLVEFFRPKAWGELRPQLTKAVDGHYIPLYTGLHGFGVNEKILKEKNLPVPETWKELGDPKYKGLIAMPNPNTSGTGYTLMTTLVQIYGEEQGFELLKAIHKNVAQYTRSGGDPSLLAGRGEVAIGVSFANDVVDRARKGFPVRFIAPKDGTGYEIGGLSLVKGGPNRENGLRFIDWAISAESQKLGPANGELSIPSNTKAPIADDVPRFEAAAVIAYDFGKYGTPAVRDGLIKRWTEQVFPLPK